MKNLFLREENGKIKSQILNYAEHVNPISGEKKVYTREEIGKMSSNEFAAKEKEIMIQMKFIGIPTEQEVKISKAQDYENDPTMEYVWITQFTAGTCDRCADLNGTRYKSLEDVEELPPLHNRCACEVIKTVEA
ncbi:MAG: hypothetical protein LBK53_02355 [Heliobacteriaceae bacterium]|jgi:hypothetical protein|nr:hypothetical protein [Heliobacteriaceae bacterium]